MKTCKRNKPFTIRNARVASRLAARAEDLLKANRDVAGEAYDRLNAIEREASYHQAGSKEAALFQIGLLADTGTRIADRASALDPLDFNDDSELSRLLSMHRRLVQSLAAYLEEVTGVDRAVCGYRFYLGPRHT